MFLFILDFDDQNTTYVFAFKYSITSRHATDSKSALEDCVILDRITF
jgi:hypothetical protein